MSVPEAVPEDVEDRKWLAAWRDGDQGAGGRLYERYAARVTRFFETKLSAKEQAAHLVHETFMVLQKTQQEVEATVRAFIFGIANNVLRHHIRMVLRDQERGTKLSQAADAGTVPMFAVDPIDPEAALGERMERRLVTKALRRLGLDDQVVLELVYWEELGRLEIARIFNVPEGTMAGRIRAARGRLAAKMAELSTSIDLLESTSKTLTTWLVELHEHINAIKVRDAEQGLGGGSPPGKPKKGA